MELVERESALAELAGFARRAQAGEGGLVLVAGEAKRGKSTLVNALLGREILPVGVTPPDANGPACEVSVSTWP